MNILDTIKRYSYLLWAEKNLEAITPFIATDATFHSVIKDTKGIDGIKRLLSNWLNAFPDLEVHWDDFICENDKVVSRWHAQGHHRGSFLGIAPTNLPVEYQGVTIYQLDNNQITDYWSYIDLQQIFNQISQ